MKSRFFLLACAALLALAGCTTRPPKVGPAVAATPPAAPREFRAVWVATVANIDWPSKPGLPAGQQRAEIVAILDRMRALNFNAIILQVRPAADALYPSRLEPWSEYLTGRQGKAPTPFYDPLKFWVEEAHRRGLELHAWINPYRARHFSAQSPLARTHIAKRRPSAVKSYGNMLWMDPGDEDAVQQTLAVMRDLVNRYDIDGVHIDDYFYPYPDRAVGDFPDGPSWDRYVKRGGKLSRDDWRRQNVDRLVEEMYRSAHALKPWVRFGVSPFGVGRPDRRPAGITGFSQYDRLYADVEKWVANGWMDYLAPQLYWPLGQREQAFAVLLKYWREQNVRHRHVWPGLFVSAVTETARGWSAPEIVKQIEAVRATPPTPPDSLGEIHFSAIALMQDRLGVATLLRQGPYAQPALVPVTPWITAQAPLPPTLSAESAAKVLIRPNRTGTKPLSFAVWKRQGGVWRFAVQPATERAIDLSANSELGAVDAVVVSAVDRLGNESARTTLALAGKQK